jgi:hypothetical protein
MRALSSSSSLPVTPAKMLTLLSLPTQPMSLLTLSQPSRALSCSPSSDKFWISMSIDPMADSFVNPGSEVYSFWNLWRSARRSVWKVLPLKMASASLLVIPSTPNSVKAARKPFRSRTIFSAQRGNQLSSSCTVLVIITPSTGLDAPNREHVSIYFNQFDYWPYEGIPLGVPWPNCSSYRGFDK